MAEAVAAYIVVLQIMAMIAVWLLAVRALSGERPTDRLTSDRRPRSGAVFRYRTTRPGLGWEPLRMTVDELRAHGLHGWPNASGVYVAHDDTIHCRHCIAEPRTRALIVAGHDVTDQVLVLFGGQDEAALVEANCATHRPPTSPLASDRNPPASADWES